MLELGISGQLRIILSVSENKRGSKWTQLLLFLPGAITFGLGSWQIVRREEKVGISSSALSNQLRISLYIFVFSVVLFSYLASSLIRLGFSWNLCLFDMCIALKSFGTRVSCGLVIRNGIRPPLSLFMCILFRKFLVLLALICI